MADPVNTMVKQNMAKAKRVNGKQVIEIDVVSRNGKPRKARNRRQRRAGGNQYGDRERTSYGGGGSRAVISYNPVPAGSGFRMPRNGLSMKSNGDVVTITRCELWKIVEADSTEQFSAPLIGAVCPFNLPWLAGVAQNFSKWRWRRFSFRYVATTSTQTSGGVGQGYGYDMAESTPAALSTVAAFDQFSYHAAWLSDTEDKVMDTGRFSRDWYPYIGSGAFGGLSTNDRNDYCPGYVSDYSGVSSLTSLGEVGFLIADYVVELTDPISAVLQPTA